MGSACEVKSEWSCCGGSVRSGEVLLYNRAVGESGLLSIAENSSAQTTVSFSIVCAVLQKDTSLVERHLSCW